MIFSRAIHHLQLLECSVSRGAMVSAFIFCRAEEGINGASHAWGQQGTKTGKGEFGSLDVGGDGQHPGDNGNGLCLQIVRT